MNQRFHSQYPNLTSSLVRFSCLIVACSLLCSTPIQAGPFGHSHIGKDLVHRQQSGGHPGKRSVNFTPSWGKRSGPGSPLGISSEEEMEIAQNMPTYSNWDQLVAKRSSSDIEECSVRGIYLELLIRKVKVEMEKMESCVRDSDIIATPQQL
ncbi:uncharacterized protein LOC131880953 [Tigriopus californicus]|uniref:uncharacterized protein LOC131880953 n=1 Tax=Tigriopus californicus TaxID=6832 RepID=UPI0027DA19C6|nr:uncharacterized protein LOC131880953 [Tigriopus californicus]